MPHVNRPFSCRSARRAATAALCCAVLALAACGPGPCEDEILEELASPDGRYVAAVMTLTCEDVRPATIEGKEVTFAKAVLMRRADAAGYGDDPMGAALFIVDGDWPIAIRWLEGGWLGINSDGPPEQILKWSANYEGGVVYYE
jgi:hypothetical protein